MYSSNVAIGHRVAQLRKKNNLTQAELAVLTGSSAKHISEIERGITGISIDMQLQLSLHLHCSLDYLIKGEDYTSVEVMLPREINEILLSSDRDRIAPLLEYLNMYIRLFHLTKDQV